MLIALAADVKEASGGFKNNKTTYGLRCQCKLERIHNVKQGKGILWMRFGDGSGKLLDWFSAIVDNRALITSIQSAPR